MVTVGRCSEEEDAKTPRRGDRLRRMFEQLLSEGSDLAVAWSRLFKSCTSFKSKGPYIRAFVGLKG